MPERLEGYFEFFGETIDPASYRAGVEEAEAHHAECDARILSGDLGPIGDMDVLHERMETLRWWLATGIEEIEEEEED